MQGASREALATTRDSLTALRSELPDAAGLGTVADGLLAVVRLLDRETSLRRTLGDPTVPAAAKGQLLDGLLGSQVAPLAMRLLTQAVGLRWSSPRDLVDALEVLGVTAVFQVAEGDGQLDDVEDELFRFARTLAREPELRAVLTDRALEPERKRALLDALLAGKATDPTRRIVDVLVATPRGRTLEDGLEEYARLASDVRSRTLATVTTAIALDDAQQQRLAASLTRQLGREVQLQVEVDPAVVGGVVVRIGDEVIDGSIRSRLAEARRQVG